MNNSICGNCVHNSRKYNTCDISFNTSISFNGERGKKLNEIKSCSFHITQEKTELLKIICGQEMKQIISY